mmetsp:Transcript_14559/g.14187  ORF Transcript_14559/g.14187 Transcript_14559/m.14187 type:complete len:177 (+) Transcript_14559:1680-2210(+)
MKIAVILGVMQMSLGIMMKGLNSIYFKKPLDFIFEFIPQIIFLWVLFGWMDVMIIGKWLQPYQLQWTTQSEYNNVSRAPNIISVMINMFLAIGKNPEDPADGEPIQYNNIFGGASSTQTTISIVFVLIMFICVPLMLCVKPIVFCCSHEEEKPAQVHEEKEDIEHAFLNEDKANSP